MKCLSSPFVTGWPVGVRYLHTGSICDGSSILLALLSYALQAAQCASVYYSRLCADIRHLCSSCTPNCVKEAVPIIAAVAYYPLDVHNSRNILLL